MTMLSRLSLGDGEGEGQVQKAQHGSDGDVKRMPTLSLLPPSLIQSRVLIDEEALQYGTHPIEPLTAMVLRRHIQEQAGSKEG